jgi:hypothetical protein
MNSSPLSRKWRLPIQPSRAELLCMAVWFSASGAVPALTETRVVDTAGIWATRGLLTSTACCRLAGGRG